jgi:ABC-type molybdenum transport system ATPase subunit/photorepair protein PhrA
MSEQYTEEEQQLIDKLKKEQDDYNGELSGEFRSLTFNLFGREFQAKTFDLEKFKRFWSIFGQVPTAAVNVGAAAARVLEEGFFTPTTFAEDEGTYPITLSKYLIRVETVIGMPFESLDPSEQEAILLAYETLKTPGLEVELDEVTSDVDLIIDMSLSNKLPEDLNFVSSDIVNQSTVTDYSDQAEASYKAF